MPVAARSPDQDTVILQLPDVAVQRRVGKVRPYGVVDLQVGFHLPGPGVSAAVAGVADGIGLGGGGRCAQADRFVGTAGARVGSVRAYQTGHRAIFRYGSEVPQPPRFSAPSPAPRGPARRFLAAQRPFLTKLQTRRQPTSTVLRQQDLPFGPDRGRSRGSFREIPVNRPQRSVSSRETGPRGSHLSPAPDVPTRHQHDENGDHERPHGRRAVVRAVGHQSKHARAGTRRG